MLVLLGDNFSAFSTHIGLVDRLTVAACSNLIFFWQRRQARNFRLASPATRGSGPAAIFLRPKTSTVCSKVSVFYQHRACFAKYDGFAVTTSEGEGRKKTAAPAVTIIRAAVFEPDLWRCLKAKYPARQQRRAGQSNEERRG